MIWDNVSHFSVLALHRNNSIIITSKIPWLGKGSTTLKVPGILALLMAEETLRVQLLAPTKTTFTSLICPVAAVFQSAPSEFSLI
jgi:hypothetical protein